MLAIHLSECIGVAQFSHKRSRRKTEADGSIWEYSYYGNGMLRKVVRPDKRAVIFKYDGLGRRIEKKQPGKQVNGRQSEASGYADQIQNFRNLTRCREITPLFIEGKMHCSLVRNRKLLM